MSRAEADRPRRGRTEDLVPFRQVAIKPELASGELWAEVEALARFWRRRAFFSFTPAEAPNGEQDFCIDIGHLTHAQQKIQHYERLLSDRDERAGDDTP